MRVMCNNGDYSNYAISVEHARIDGKRLIFVTYSGVRYVTKEYFAYNIALAKLGDLVTNGYIFVDELYVLE